MKIRYKSNQRKWIEILTVYFAVTILWISLLSSSLLPVVLKSYTENEKVQNPTETNISKILPLVIGFADFIQNLKIYYDKKFRK